MRNMAVIQFVLKVHSEQHTQVGQHANERIDKAFHTILVLNWSQKDRGNRPTVLVAVSPRFCMKVLFAKSMHTDTIIKEVHVNVYSLQLLSFITYTAKKAALDTRTVCYIHSIHSTHAHTQPLKKCLW